MMLPQRARSAEIGWKTSHQMDRRGCREKQVFCLPSILQRGGIRQLPGICWYPVKRTAQL